MARYKAHHNFIFYTYILYSMKDKKLYTGFTSDLKKRVEEHNNVNVFSTKHRRPLKLIYYEDGLRPLYGKFVILSAAA